MKRILPNLLLLLLLLAIGHELHVWWLAQAIPTWQWEAWRDVLLVGAGLAGLLFCGTGLAYHYLVFERPAKRRRERA